MRIEFLGKKGTWVEVLNSCRTTIGKNEINIEPSSEWKTKILQSEHSPIRQLIYKFKWYELPYWVSVHFTRHKIGIEHWVRTQRTDRTNTDRELLPQGTFVENEIKLNTKAIITITRKR